MTDEFNKIYDELYSANAPKLEEYRKSQIASFWKIVIPLIIVIALFIIFPPLMMLGFPIIIILIVISTITVISKGKKLKAENKYDGLSYSMFFKEKIITPLIKSVNEKTEYFPTEGIDESEYRKAGFESYYDRYDSEDKINILLSNNDNKESNYMTLSEVHTQRKSTDKDGHTSYYTMFHGLMGYVDLGKVSESYINIKRNGSVMGWNKNKLNMDMSEFEKYFDVETDNKIEAMQILTSDIMAQLVDFVTTSKIQFEIHIINKTMYMRFMTGAMFEPNIFGNSMQKELIWKYYSTAKFCMNLSINMCNIVNETKI